MTGSKFLLRLLLSVFMAVQLPSIGKEGPLADADPDVSLDLQAAFDRCWEEGPYEDTLNYEQNPPGALNSEEKRWVKARLKATQGRK